jgi:hypothetical protein
MISKNPPYPISIIFPSLKAILNNNNHNNNRITIKLNINKSEISKENISTLFKTINPNSNNPNISVSKNQNQYLPILNLQKKKILF